MKYATKVGLIRELMLWSLIIAGMVIVCCWFWLMNRFFPSQTILLCGSTAAVFVVVYFLFRPFVLRTIQPWTVPCPTCGRKSATLKWVDHFEYLICDQCTYKEQTGLGGATGGDDI